ncbi:MAG: aminotransferase class I/II-fold pyridoxal phosphate-dependent enzyme, partial [Verrucomicrobia bacterium]|nr:aminotransferase class I/II-fold pyridoxal phosphate-dependent enzyme [Verrucomicrobiota bacterium]
NRARSFIYSTAPPAATAAASLVAIKLLVSDEGEQLRKKLRHHIEQVSGSIDQIQTSQSPILPLIIGSSQDALNLSARLYSEGLLIPAIRYPTVPRDQARLRITLSATHSCEQIDHLIDTLASCQM